MYAAAANTTKKLNMLPETALAPESLVGVVAAAAVALRVAVLVADLVADEVAEAVELSGFSNRMCGMNPVGSDESVSLVSVEETDSPALVAEDLALVVVAVVVLDEA